LELQVVRAWQAHNKPADGPTGAGEDIVDDLAYGYRGGRADSFVRQAINTTIQWLGTPIGLQWVMSALGFEDFVDENDLKLAIKAFKKAKKAKKNS
jgi:hypothetical protein